MKDILTNIDTLEGFINIQGILPGGCMIPLYGVEPPVEEQSEEVEQPK